MFTNWEQMVTFWEKVIIFGQCQDFDSAYSGNPSPYPNLVKADTTSSFPANLSWYLSKIWNYWTDPKLWKARHTRMHDL